MSLPKIAVTMGDPAGIGPEICLRLLADETMRRICIPVVFGDAQVLQAAAASSFFPAPKTIVESLAEVDRYPALLDLKVIDPATFEPGIGSSFTGSAAYACIEAAIEAAQKGDVAAVVTGPINKNALRASGIEHPGHTEIFAEKTGTTRYCMMQYSKEITCSFVTVHVGYAEVPKLLTTERIFEVIELTDEALRRIRKIDDSKILVCGLNPHAGEDGLFGDGEENAVILPAIERARNAGLNVEGPVSPDTAFTPASRSSHDAVVCMYHDQGHIPVKALAFDQAVNITLGLPIVRTSVDHGTAFDIAWKGKANPSSLYEAVKLATTLI